MIARPVHRPLPIPFDTDSSASDSAPTRLSLGNSASRAVSWAAALGPGTQAGGVMHMPTRLSPARVSLSAATQASNSASSSSAAAAAAVAVAVAVANVGGPRPRSINHGANTLTEPSARYVGQGGLSVRSSVTGRHYRFQGHGDSLVIDRSDVVLLKRISDLVIR